MKSCMGIASAAELGCGDVLDHLRILINSGASRSGKGPNFIMMNPNDAEYNYVRLPRRLKKKLKSKGIWENKKVIGFKKHL